MKHANFQIIENTANVMKVRDLGDAKNENGKGRPTITKDIAWIVKRLHDDFNLGTRQLVCVDRNGDCSEIEHNGEGTFLKFNFYVAS